MKRLREKVIAALVVLGFTNGVQILDKLWPPPPDPEPTRSAETSDPPIRWHSSTNADVGESTVIVSTAEKLDPTDPDPAPPVIDP